MQIIASPPLSSTSPPSDCKDTKNPFTAAHSLSIQRRAGGRNRERNPSSLVSLDSFIYFAENVKE